MYMKNKKPNFDKVDLLGTWGIIGNAKENYGEVNDYLNIVPFPPFIVGSIIFF